MPEKFHIFLVASEAKDTYCLQPLEGPLLSALGAVWHLDVSPMLSGAEEMHYSDAFLERIFVDLSALAFSENAIVICASPLARKFVALIRDKAPFISVGIEHGFAPFKAHTFGAEFQKNDLYLAPTVLWAERLKRLYSFRPGQIQVGGYPRSNILRELLDINSATPLEDDAISFWKGAEEGRRKLVIFSWGVNVESINGLPDLTEIVYLLHASEESLLAKFNFHKASVVASSPNVLSILLSHADIIVGDFSSLTFEAMHLGYEPLLFICRELYRCDCDMPESFFDRESSEFARIPRTEHKLDSKCILDYSALVELLEKENKTSVPRPPLRLPEGFLPPMDRDARHTIVAAIADFAFKYNATDLKISPKQINVLTYRVQLIMFIAQAYRQILRRNPDLVGLSHYVEKMLASSEPAPIKAISFLAELAQSKEGRSRLSNKPFDWPRVTIRLLPPAVTPPAGSSIEPSSHI